MFRTSDWTVDEMHLDVNLRSTSPTAMGLSPSPFFLVARREVPQVGDNILRSIARAQEVNHLLKG